MINNVKKVPPAQVSVGMNSKEQLLRFRLFNIDMFFLRFLFHLLLLCQFFFTATQKMLKVIKIFIKRDICVYMK